MEQEISALHLQPGKCRGILVQLYKYRMLVLRSILLYWASLGT